MGEVSSGAERLDFRCGAGGERVDVFLSGAMQGYSRSYIQKLIKGGLVTAKGRALKPNYRTLEGDVISVAVPEAEKPDIAPEDIPLDIIYEDDDILVVNKPKGMVVHPAPGHARGTLVNAVMFHCKGKLSGINGVLRPGIVHRIDKDTTGLIVVCKNDRSHRSLAGQLKTHSLSRIYHAVVLGNIKEDSGTIDAPIGRSPSDRKKMSASAPSGRGAVTHFRVLERFGGYTYVECTLETGRTHQIRVHMASKGHPVLGDAVYGPSKCPFKLQGQALHAKTLKLCHPVTGEHMQFDSPLPQYFLELLEKLRGNVQRF